MDVQQKSYSAFPAFEKAGGLLVGNVNSIQPLDVNQIPKGYF